MRGYAVREGWWVGYRCHSLTIMNVKMGQTLHVGHSNMTKGELGVLYFIGFHSYGHSCGRVRVTPHVTCIQDSVGVPANRQIATTIDHTNEN